MIIKITQEHIDNGKPGEAFKCPIALALHDAGVKGYASCRPIVGADFIYMNNCVMRQPPTINKFRHAFDNHIPVEPFEFDTDELKAEF